MCYVDGATVMWTRFQQMATRRNLVYGTKLSVESDALGGVMGAFRVLGVKNGDEKVVELDTFFVKNTIKFKSDLMVGPFNNPAGFNITNKGANFGKAGSVSWEGIPEATLISIQKQEGVWKVSEKVTASIAPGLSSSKTIMALKVSYSFSQPYGDTQVGFSMVYEREDRPDRDLMSLALPFVVKRAIEMGNTQPLCQAYGIAC